MITSLVQHNGSIHENFAGGPLPHKYDIIYMEKLRSLIKGISMRCLRFMKLLLPTLKCSCLSYRVHLPSQGGKKKGTF